MQLDIFNEYDNKSLLFDLFQAYYDARKNKRNTLNALNFEVNYEHYILKLYEEIISENYKIRPSICFINSKPVQREIFAADFRDRVVHHLVYNYIASIFDNIFINDSYSCRKGKGTHYGIRRVNKFIRSCSQNYKKDCYILKLDVKGFFMSIYRPLLNKLVKQTLQKQKHKIVFNLELVSNLLEQIIFNDPTKNYILKGNRNDWNGLPPSKSLFYSGQDKGLPIGNLTSQLFSNIYFNQFDHYVKKELGIKYYGRYVDDFIIVHPNKFYLLQIIPLIKNYLKKELFLELHPKKIYLQHFSKGVSFLGAIIKPHRIYITARIKNNIYHSKNKWNIILKQNNMNSIQSKYLLSSINSYIGVLKHYHTNRLINKLLFKDIHPYIWNHFEPIYERNFDENYNILNNTNIVSHLAMKNNNTHN